MTTPLRVVHVYKDYWPPIVGGIERCINWMAHGVAARGGYEVTVLVNSRTGETRERTDGPLRVIEVGEWGRAFSAPLSPAFPHWLRRLEADVWHFHIPNPTGDASYLVARPRGAVVATYHSDIVRQKWALGVYGPFLRAFLRRCDVVMPTSPRLVDASPFLRGVSDRCTPVPLGMPLDRFDASPGRARRSRDIKRRYKGFPLVTFLGKLRYYKGVQFLVSAMRGLPHTHLLLLGDGPEREKLGRLAEEFGVSGRVHFLGELPDDEVVDFLHASDVFVLPSHLPSEAFGLVQVEAMACGVPVVSTGLPTGVPWVNQDGETGLVVPPGDDEALARAIASLLDNPQRRMEMGERAYRRAREEFSIGRLAERLDGVYRAAVERRARR